MKVYVAGASKDAGRVRYWMDRLIREGVEVSHDWITLIEEAGSSNEGLSFDLQEEHAMRDLTALTRSDLFWLLEPPKGVESRGAYFEAGFAFMAGVPSIASVAGGVSQTIFTSLIGPTENDEDAFAEIVMMAHTPQVADLDDEAIARLVKRVFNDSTVLGLEAAE